MPDQNPEEAPRPRHLPPPKYVHFVSARVSDEQIAIWEDFRASFDYPSNAEAFRWLLSSDAGKELIGKKIRGDVS